MAYIDHGDVRLVSRNGHTLRQFDDLRSHIGRELRVRDAIVDGEIVVRDDNGKSLFQPLMRWQGQPSFVASICRG